MGHPLGIVSWAAFLTVLVAGGKTYYAAPTYLALLPAGCCWFEQAASRRLRRTLPAALAAGGLATAPLALPILPPAQLTSYLQALGLRPPPTERGASGALHPYFADRFGWDNMARQVAAVYQSMPRAEQAACWVLTGNDGQAAALEYYAASYALPPVASGHNTYDLWGPPQRTGRILLAVGIPRDELTPFFDSVEEAGRIRSRWAVPYEQDLPILVCRELRAPPAEAWPNVKRFL